MGVFKDLITFDNWLDIPELEEDAPIKETVFICVDGGEYLVSVNADVLLRATDPTVEKRERIKQLDIKGLGLLSYRNRKILSAGRKGGLIYYLNFDLKYA